MEKYESLEEVLEGNSTLNKKVEEAFSSLPAENWMPLKRKANSFPVAVENKNSMEARTAIVYEVRPNIEQNNFFGRLYKDENKVYLSNGREYSSGKSKAYMFFSKRIGNSYRNVAFADYSTKKVVFDSDEVEKMSAKQLSRFAYAINQYLSGNYANM
ncbi:MAG: hypothetical protein OH338_01145 [Candidatus Parvarchaeota archaeon]|nr:hypothetical protein [Candidatus Parvarchaeota archaeon]MCW1295938.1 hypothetical protein [Candidatus Parvarchaeum tengchongense]MCW1299592.1 hypothetical protein [Candidatus Parvarchaeum tengchongense]MCW1312021.1 hypothetical protein [Candidatus Parvarchaeum tengchongense]